MKIIRIAQGAAMVTAAKGLALTFAMAIGCLTHTQVSAEEDLPDHNLSEWSVGATVTGSSVDLKKTEGKVVAIEYWGTR